MTLRRGNAAVSPAGCSHGAGCFHKRPAPVSSRKFFEHFFSKTLKLPALLKRRVLDLPHRAGCYIPQPTGYKAFVPAPLPPEPPLADSGEMQNLRWTRLMC